MRTVLSLLTSVRMMAVIALVGLNIATLTSTAVFNAASAALSAAGLSTVAAREATVREARAKTVKRATNRVTRRTVRQAARTTATSAAEAIPLVGVAVIAGSLALEVKEACDTAEDMVALKAAVASDADPAAAEQTARETFDCTTLVPGADVPPSARQIWSKMTAAPDQAWTAAKDAGVDLPSVDWNGFAGAALDRVADTLGGLVGPVLGRQ